MSSQSFVLGTAGHIDHGKTALVRALSGVDCDRLPEEQSRGITIDLGFAHFEAGGFRFGIVDVPGHERFVHNMVAGATGIDLALLVVACDDSVMPQTREHLAILDLLGIRSGVVALTKRDLVDDEMLEFVRDDVAALLAGTLLADAPLVAVSSLTGEGIPELTAEIVHAAERLHPGTDAIAAGNESQNGSSSPCFRLPIDRVFTLHGHGTVVTGTVRSGRTEIGRSLAVLPEGREVRVRRLQSHGVDVERIATGQRAAVNLAGVKQDEIRRGDELAEPDGLQPTRRLLAEIKVLEAARRPLKHRRLVRLHLAAKDVTARVLLDGPQIDPGESGCAVLLCETPVVAEYDQRFILRKLSPVDTLGGGRVLSPVPGRTRTRQLLTLAPRLADADPATRLDAYLEQQGEDELEARSLAVRVGIDPQRRDALVQSLVRRESIAPASEGAATFLHAARRQRLKDLIVRRCEREIERRRPARMTPLAPLRTAAARWTSAAVVEGLLDELVSEGRLIRRGGRVGAAGETAQLTGREQAVLNEFVDACRSGGAAPPSLKDFAAAHKLPLKQLEPLVQVAIDSGRLVRVSPELVVDPEALESVRTAAVELLIAGPATVAQLKERWQVSRKYAVPYLEFFDQLGVTVRDGDARRPGPRAHCAIEDLVE